MVKRCEIKGVVDDVIVKNLDILNRFSISRENRILEYLIGN